MLGDGGELALIDVREELIFSQSHLLLARSVPLSRFELKFARLVPRRATRIVLCDDDDGLAARAAAILSRNGYTDLAILAGGVAAWGAAGFELFSGVNVPSKAFGEYIEHAKRHAEHRGRRAGTAAFATAPTSSCSTAGRSTNMSRVSIPTATNVPGAELVLRAREIAPSPETHGGRQLRRPHPQHHRRAIADQCRRCRTRSWRLRNGTMGWSLAGFACESRQKPPRAGRFASDARLGATSGATRGAKLRRRAHRSPDARSLARGRANARFTSSTCAIPPNTKPAMWPARSRRPAANWCRRPINMSARSARASCWSTMPRSAPPMTASWLRQMGFADVFVLAEAGTETGWPDAPVLRSRSAAATPPSTAPRSASCSSGNAATVVDLSLSRDYLARHIPGAWFAIRTRLERGARKRFRCTARWCSPPRMACWRVWRCPKRPPWSIGRCAFSPAAMPRGRRPGMPSRPKPRWPTTPSINGASPTNARGDTKAAMSEYLAWETDLLPRIERDGSLKFASASLRGFEQNFGEPLRHIDHHVVAAGHFVGAP